MAVRAIKGIPVRAFTAYTRGVVPLALSASVAAPAGLVGVSDAAVGAHIAVNRCIENTAVYVPFVI